VGEEGFDFRGFHLLWMTFVVDEDEAFDPVGVGFFGTDGTALETDGVRTRSKSRLERCFLAAPETDLRYSGFCFILCAIRVEVHYSGYRTTLEMQTMEAGRGTLSRTFVLAVEGDSAY
jgi:hypothetical protein